MPADFVLSDTPRKGGREGQREGKTHSLERYFQHRSKECSSSSSNAERCPGMNGLVILLKGMIANPCVL